MTKKKKSFSWIAWFKASWKLIRLELRREIKVKFYDQLMVIQVVGSKVPASKIKEIRDLVSCLDIPNKITRVK